MSQLLWPHAPSVAAIMTMHTNICSPPSVNSILRPNRSTQKDDTRVAATFTASSSHILRFYRKGPLEFDSSHQVNGDRADRAARQ